MYKKIAAGVMAAVLTFGSALLPAEMFAGMNAVTAVSVSAAESFGDYKYEILEDGTIEITNYTGKETSLIIPSEINGRKVTSIGKRAFDYTAFTSVEIPDGITNIGSFAFTYCTALETINIPNSVAVIGENAFANCKMLKSITIPKGVARLEALAFYSCTALSEVNLPDTLTYIGKNTFGRCEALTAIDIPESVTGIGPYAFSYDTNLKSLDIPENVTYIGENAFLQNTWYESMPEGMIYFGRVAYKYKGTMPENTAIDIKPGTACIGNYAFENCALAAVTIPDSVTAVGEGSFSGTSIKEINLPDTLDTIGQKAFSNCTQLEAIDIPKSVTSIGEKAFSGCSSIETVEIPQGITTIEYNTFAYCTSLKRVRIPDSVTEIGLYAFSYCESLADINIGSNIQKIQGGAFQRCAIESMVIPDGIKIINQYTFSGCKNLVSVAVPDSVTEIVHDAFNDCPKLESFSIPEGVTEIGGKAFYKCNSLKSLKIPAAVTNLGTKSIGYCYDSETRKDYIPEDFTMICTKDSAAEAYAVKNGIKYTTEDEPVVKTDISECIVILNQDEFEYTGEEIKPEVTVKYGNETLKEGIDYTLVYENNINTGTAKAVVKGTGNYCGTAAKNFIIIESKPVITDITKCEITLSGTEFSYTGNAIKPKVTVKAGDKVLTLGTDYAVRYINNTEIGTATVRIAGKGDYTGTVEKTFTIVGETVITEIPKCDITLSGTEFSYTGNAVKPKVTVKAGSKVLTLGTDYAVRYVNNVNVGTASIVIAGRGDYTGSVTKTFTITDSITKELSKCTVSLSKTVFKSTGSAIKPKVTVKDGSQTLTLGTDYLVRYVNNVEPGTASVVIAGRGNYTGSVTKTFTILDSNAKDIAECEITLNKTSFTYTGNGIKPKVTVKDGDTVLTSSVDYNIRYVNNVNVGTATVVVSGTGKYQGSVNMNFDITAD